MEEEGQVQSVDAQDLVDSTAAGGSRMAETSCELAELSPKRVLGNI